MGIFRTSGGRDALVLGWCGQSAAPGYALQLLDPTPRSLLMTQKSLDFLSTTRYKEGAWAALEGFLAAHTLTGEPRYLDWALHAADVVLTYVVVWDIDLPPGRLRDHDFKTRGWTAVSVQNQHIDVFGVLIAPSLYRLGRITGRAELEEVAQLMFRSCRQLIDPFGSQGEQPQQTNYAQRGDLRSAFGHRGGYVEDWTVFWITAHFLNAAAQFKELGLTWE